MDSGLGGRFSIAKRTIAAFVMRLDWAAFSNAALSSPCMEPAGRAPAHPADLSPAFVAGMRTVLLRDSRIAYEYIPSIVAYVKKTTGRQRFRELATLIGTALGNREFDVHQLKMICLRRGPKAHKR
jgi:hypothetical protein